MVLKGDSDDTDFGANITLGNVVAANGRNGIVVLTFVSIAANGVATVSGTFTAQPNTTYQIEMAQAVDDTATGSTSSTPRFLAPIISCSCHGLCFAKDDDSEIVAFPL